MKHAIVQDFDPEHLKRSLAQMGRNAADYSKECSQPAAPFYRSVLARAVAMKRKGKDHCLLLTEADLELADFVIQRLSTAGFEIVPKGGK